MIIVLSMEKIPLHSSNNKYILVDYSTQVYFCLEDNISDNVCTCYSYCMTTVEN